MNARIVLVENQTDVVQEIEQALNSANYCIKTALSGSSGLNAVRESRPDLMLLDWNLPDISGVEICRQLRSMGNDIPIILLNDDDAVGDRVAGLDAGADDYLIRPVNSKELTARVHALLRRIRRHQSAHTLRFADLVLDLNAREVYRANRFISLTAKEFDLLEYLMQHPHQVVTRDQILEHVWRYEYVGSSNIIEVYVRYLRRKLEAGREGRLIHTVRGVGYVLKAAQVEALPLSA